MDDKDRRRERAAALRQQAELREQAEALASEQAPPVPEDLAARSPDEIGRTLHELRVHQIELEMQNEELRRAQVALDVARARYFELYDLAPVGYLTLDDKGIILEANLTAATLLGVARSALARRPLSPFILGEDQDVFYRHRQQLFATGAAQAWDLRMKQQDGTAFWARLEATAAQDADGVPVCRLIIVDITERKRAEAALGESERRYRVLVNTLQEGIWAIDDRMCTTFVNPHMARLLGYAAEEMTGRPLFDFMDERGKEIAAAHFERRRLGITEQHDFEFRRRDGTALIANLETCPLLDEGGGFAGALAAVTDITARRRAEVEQASLQSQLFQAQKMEAVGQLAGGIAHDFNNLLCGILGGLSLLESEHGEHPAIQQDIQEMKALVERGATLTKQLLGFARRGKYDVRPLDLARVVAQTAELFGSTHRHLAIELDLAPDLLAVLFDHTQLEQVLLNLLLNADQAMAGGPQRIHSAGGERPSGRSQSEGPQRIHSAGGERPSGRSQSGGPQRMIHSAGGERPSGRSQSGGRLSLRAENVELSGEQTAAHGAAPGRFIRLAMADTGIGMDAATRARIFEPFFTTKDAAHGTGLGLASVHGIVTSHGGFVEVESEVGRGSTFTLFLPATDLPGAQAGVRAASISRGTETILIVDDEAPMRKLLDHVLRRAGYTVLIAAGGQQAIELVRQHGATIALVILDMTMPEMSGGQTFDALRAIAPELKVLLSSGYSADGQAQEILQRGGSSFIQKPYDAATLTAKVREVL